MRISDWSSDLCSSDLLDADGYFGFPGTALWPLGPENAAGADRRGCSRHDFPWTGAGSRACTSQMSGRLTLLDIDSPVARLTLNRPERHNSLVPELISSLLENLREV